MEGAHHFRSSDHSFSRNTFVGLGRNHTKMLLDRPIFSGDASSPNNTIRFENMRIEFVCAFEIKSSCSVVFENCDIEMKVAAIIGEGCSLELRNCRLEGERFAHLQFQFAQKDGENIARFNIKCGSREIADAIRSEEMDRIER